MRMIELIISDFDGTLVDTFNANFYSYEKAFKECDMVLEYTFYKDCFGLRFDSFIKQAGIKQPDIINYIKNRKREVYPEFFSFLRLNNILYNYLMAFRKAGGKIAIASTASRENLYNVVEYFNMAEQFDYILSGNEVQKGKPDPEIYFSLLEKLNVKAINTLIFEDSDSGIIAATASGANCIKVTSSYFDHPIS